MFYELKERCIVLGEYIIDNNATVRGAAQRFGVSKSTVHKDVTVKLKKTDVSLYQKVAEVLAKNKAQRHLRGGEATRKKYLEFKK